MTADREISKFGQRLKPAPLDPVEPTAWPFHLDKHSMISVHRDREHQIRNTLPASHLTVPDDPSASAGGLIRNMKEHLSPGELSTPLDQLFLMPVFAVLFHSIFPPRHSDVELNPD